MAAEQVHSMLPFDLKCPQCDNTDGVRCVVCGHYWTAHTMNAPPTPEPKFKMGDKVFDRGDNRHTICKGPYWKTHYDDNLYQWWYQTEDGCWRREKTLALAPPEPLPEPKFKIGQCVETPQGMVGRIVEYRLFRAGIYQMLVRYSDSHTLWLREVDLKPHAPVLTDKQRRMLPGDKVRRCKVMVNVQGVPVLQHHQVGTEEIQLIRLICNQPAAQMVAKAWGALVYLWNLEPVEEGTANGKH